MTHTKDEELQSAAEFLQETLEEMDLPAWDDLSDIVKKNVIKRINEKLDDLFNDHMRHFIFGVKYDITERLHLVAYPISSSIQNDRIPGGQYVDIL